jgi:hypothetical protein
MFFSCHILLESDTNYWILLLTLHNVDMHIKGENNLFQSSSVIIFSLKNKHLKLPFLNNFYLTK